MLQYWLAVSIKGVRDSLDFVKQDTQGIIFAVLVLILTILWLVRKHGWQDAMKHWWRSVGEGLVIAIVAWVLVLVVHLIWEPYHMQDDLAKNRAQLQKVYDQRQSELTTCSSNLATEQAKVGLLKDQIGAQQVSLNAQQSTLNVCVTGSIEKLKEKTQTMLVGTKLISADPKKAAHFQDLLLMSNQPVAADFRLHCNIEIVDVSAGLLNASTVTGGRGGGRVSLHDWDISFGSPLLSPANPLNVVVYYNQATEASCTFSKI